MKAVCWFGTHDVRVEDVPDPRILNPRDAIVRVTRTAICGSDLHLFDGFIPTMEQGDILGHEFMGEVVEVGPEVRNLQVGDRVVVPFAIACGNCWFCKHELWSLCDNSNPNAYMGTHEMVHVGLPHAEAQACRKGGTVSVPGVYGCWSVSSAAKSTPAKSLRTGSDCTKLPGCTRPSAKNRTTASRS